MKTISDQLWIAARTASTYFPSLLDAKFAARRTINRVFRRLPEEELAVVSQIPKNYPGVFIDGGANRGQTVDALRQIRPDVVIHAFEPNPHLAAKLKQLLAKDECVVIYPLGLSDKAETRDLYVPYYRGYMFDGLASFDEQCARGWLAEEGRIIAFDPDKLEIKCMTCTTVTLDSLVLEPSFIKLDVQGYEINVLRGGELTIRMHEPIRTIEAPRDDLRNSLSLRIRL